MSPRILAIYVVLFVLAAVGVPMVANSGFEPAERLQTIVATVYVGIHESFGAQQPCAGGSAEDYWCWEAHFKALAYKNPQSALAKLRAEYLQGSYPGKECHALLHVIGKAAAVRYGTISDAFLRGDAFCQSGYYHGVLMGVFSETGADTLLASTDSICRDVQGKQRYSRDYFLCVHGIGHGLMTYFDRNVEDALRACGSLSGMWEEQACAGGVFMENVMSAEASTFLKQDDLTYPCSVVEKQYRYNCYMYHVPYVWAQLGNTSDVFSFCDELDDAYRAACYQGLGGSVIDSSYSAEHVIAECAIAKDQLVITQCLLGAGHEFLVYYHSLARAQALCDGAGEHREYCKEALASTYADF